jgi:hypothetical protein
VPDLSLDEYVRRLVGLLDLREPAAAARMRRAAGQMRASVGLDAEEVEVWFAETGELVVSEEPDDRRLDGSGWTDRETVLDLLAGRIEASRAILEGRIHVAGTPDAVVAVLLAIEILIDGATRIPALQELAGRLVEAATPGAGVQAATTDRAAATVWYPRARPDSEEVLLTRLGLVAERRHPPSG